MPPATLEAFRDHGVTAKTVDADLSAAERVISDLAAAGIPLAGVTDQLLADGLTSFQKSFDTLIAGLEAKAKLLGRSLAASR
jgi:transaldolase